MAGLAREGRGAAGGGCGSTSRTPTLRNELIRAAAATYLTDCDVQVMGGTCDSVGVAGCWLGGCYGPFTKKFGNGAVNLLEAKLVLPNGTLITASESSHPDVMVSLEFAPDHTAQPRPHPLFTVLLHQLLALLPTTMCTGGSRLTSRAGCPVGSLA